ncbi:MAG: hypothetical protein EPO07_07555 [Verrucomicrobia bacterium]|nr:MAG: hypothetical protein EPO07_07555 [Verrucomicrobiota bacterium]
MNKPIAAGNFIYANPLNASPNNNATNVLKSIADGTTVSVWLGASFDVWTYDTSLGIDPLNWYADDGVTPKFPPVLPPGKGFFLNPPAPSTNTFVGETVPAPGTTNTYNIASGNQLIGSPLPVGGAVTNSGWSFPTVDGTSVSKWVGAAFDVWIYDGSLGITPDGWYADDGVTPKAAPSFTVGEGFFFNAPAPAQWKQSLP